MAVNVRHPLWLPAAPAPGISVFAGLYLIETFTRASITTVVPLQAFDLIRDGQRVSFLYTAVALAALGISFFIPLLIRLASRRWVYTIGALCFIAASVLLVTMTVAGQVGGMLARVAGTACLNVTLNLYILDHIRKRDYVRNDSARLGLSVLGWTAGPYLGVWLYTHHGPEAAYGLSAALACVLIAVFWYLRLKEGTPIRAARMKAPRPSQYLGRFMGQPRLRLAWLIAFGRSSYWSTLFVYGPILMVAGGLGSEAGGLLVSAANALLISILVWGRAGERFGVRRLATFGFSMAGVILLAAAWSGEVYPLATAGLLLGATLFIIPLDAVGGVPFYRAVHSAERAEMTSVYRTYLDIGELLPPLIYGLLLGVFGLGAVFAALAGLQIFCAAMTWRYVHKRL